MDSNKRWQQWSCREAQRWHAMVRPQCWQTCVWLKFRANWVFSPDELHLYHISDTQSVLLTHVAGLGGERTPKPQADVSPGDCRISGIFFPICLRKGLQAWEGISMTVFLFEAVWVNAFWLSPANRKYGKSDRAGAHLERYSTSRWSRHCSIQLALFP